MQGTQGTQGIQGEGARQVNEWRSELSRRLYNGANFTGAGALIWLVLAPVWLFVHDLTVACWITVGLGCCIAPLALAFGRLFGIPMDVPGNPLGMLAAVFTFGQFLLYPLLIVFILRIPEYYLIASASVTAAHMLGYAWLYQARGYAVAGVVGVLGVAALAVFTSQAQLFGIPLFMFVCTGALTGYNVLNCRTKVKHAVTTLRHAVSS
jgi:hypothetical protein